MPELRWTLLIIGVLFIVVLAWWERRRPHQASRQAPHISGEPRPPANDDGSWGPDIAAANPRAAREPTLTLPEIRTDVRTREPTAPPRELPVVEIPDDSLIGLRADAEGVEDEIAAAEPMPAEHIAREHRAAEPDAEELLAEEPLDEEPEDEESVGPVVESMSAVYPEAPALPQQTASMPPQMTPVPPQTTPVPPQTTPVPPQTTPVPPQTTPVLRTTPVPPPLGNTAKPIVAWPPEDQRKLVSLRLVARPPERFRGSLVRQALAAEGFVLGEFEIFHKPDAENRAVLSAASLTKPGTFDLETMDSQRFVGLNLFAVLPGPKSPQKTFEDLLLTARMLNERLEGGLQDDRGGPLTPTRIQALRDALGGEAKS